MKKSEFPGRLKEIKNSIAWIKIPESNRALLDFILWIKSSKVLPPHIFAEITALFSYSQILHLSIEDRIKLWAVLAEAIVETGVRNG